MSANAEPLQPTTTPTRRARAGLALFVAAMLIYAATRLVGLADYPIYFFSDEAIQAVAAADLIRDDFRNSDGLLWPPYFKNYAVWNLSLSVYLQLLPVRLFGMSIYVTRLVSVWVGMMGVAAVAATLRNVFRARGWYLSVLVLATTPAWFLHSRTAFETAEMVAFYALFILCYLLYRGGRAGYIFPALVFAAAAFYSYSNGQAIIGLLALALAVVDAPYHWRQIRATSDGRRVRNPADDRVWNFASRISPVVLFLALVVLLALPYVRFRMNYPTDLAYHLRSLNSYWFNDTTPAEKLGEFADRYLYGLSPRYWFRPNDHDLMRHRMLGYYGHMRPEFLPLVVLGLVVAVGGLLPGSGGARRASYRVVLLALLAAPVGAALVDIAITRVLSAVVPATLLIGIGIDWVLRWVAAFGAGEQGSNGAGEKGGRRSAAVSMALFALLALMSLGLLRLALDEGPTWFTDYTMGGMQYGAGQLFPIIEEQLAADPNTRVMLSPDWANGTDMFPRFFLPAEQQARVQTLNVDAFISEKRELTPDMLFVMLPGEVDRARASGKFAAVDVLDTIPYPDGRPGFLMARLTYWPDVDAVFAAELEALRQPVTESIALDGGDVTVTHTRFEAGSLPDLFDGDTFTLVRHISANPVVYEIAFDAPRPVGGLALDLGTMDAGVTVTLVSPAGEAVAYEQAFRGLGPDPHVAMVFDRGPESVAAMRLELRDLNAGEDVKIHVREIGLGN